MKGVRTNVHPHDHHNFKAKHHSPSEEDVEERPQDKTALFSNAMSSFRTESSFDMSSDLERAYATEAKPVDGLLKLAAARHFQKWEKITSSLLKRGNWARLGQLAKSLNILPDDVSEIFNKIEKTTTITLNHDQRLLYYQDFTRSALGSTTLHSKEVEAIILKRNPEVQITYSDLHTLITSKLEISAGSKVGSEHNDYFDFENFAGLVYDLLRYHEEKTLVQHTSGSVLDILRQLPLDPDSGRKQARRRTPECPLPPPLSPLPSHPLPPSPLPSPLFPLSPPNRDLEHGRRRRNPRSRPVRHRWRL